MEVTVHCCAGGGDTAGRAAGVWPVSRSRSRRQPGIATEFEEPGIQRIPCAADVFAAVFRHPPDSESVAVVQPYPGAEFPEPEHDQPQLRAVQAGFPKSINKSEPLRESEPTCQPESACQSKPGSKRFLQSPEHVDQPACSVRAFERSGFVRPLKPVAESGKIVHSQSVAAIVLDAFGD